MKTTRQLRAEWLEDRRMLHGDGPLPSITLETNVGDIRIELFAEETPQTVANFLNYVHDNDYVNSIFHRSATNFVIQGGGFTSTSTTLCDLPCDQADSIDADMFDRVPTDDPVQNEFGISNLRGTVSMAKLGGDPNSATSQFFVNLNDNSGNLDGQNGGFTVFGQVVDMTVPDEIASFSKANLSSVNSAFNELPFFETENTFEIVRVNSVIGDAVLQGNVFHDRNGDGLLGSGEGGLPGAQIYLDTNNNSVLDAGEATTTSDSLGNYHFVVNPGTYIIRANGPHPDYVDTTGNLSYSRTVEIGELGGSADFSFRYVGTAWHNPTLAADVDGRNGVTPRDALLVINELTNRELSDPDNGELPPTNTTASNLQFLDVFEDGIVSPLDALRVINELPDGNALRAPSSSGQGGVATAQPLLPSTSFDTDVDDDSDAENARDDFFSSLGFV
jgi:cyclophilin family peptidyl-prolyl cis-trans isomerase